MNSKIKNIFSISLTVLLATLIVGAVVLATAGSGTLAPAGAPSAGPTMHTITDIYNKITGATVTPHEDLNPTGAPADGTYTLEDVFNAVPTDGTATEADVCNSATFYAGGGAIRTGGRTNCSAAGGGALTWSDAVAGLCWDTDPDDEWNTEGNDGPYCDAGALGGWLTTPNLTPVGAVEYCQYLNTAGTALTDSIGIWSLPTESQLLAGLSDQFILALPSQTGFRGGTYYWSSSEDGSTYAWNAVGSYGFGDVFNDLDYKYNQGYSFRCVH